MNCEHANEHLVGSSDGIFCRNCGRKFDNFAEIVKERDGLKKALKAADSDDNGVIDNSIEKSKTEAVSKKPSRAKGAKGVKK